ncbi:MAG TPA: DUF1674 domain-containing protein [Kaistiaceae bacterium]|nr:DUF1674 domain-containing protein [Kaistiaceae bacterium]
MQTAKKTMETAADRRAAAAERALAEAADRREHLDAHRFATEPEIGGRNGPDPARYGDWEKNGIASDF